MFKWICVLTLMLNTLSAATPRNVILFIGDGMGPEQVRVGRVYHGEKLCFECFPHQGLVHTHNVDGKDTDSAAAGTAMASGTKVHNRVLSCNGGKPLKTLVEYAQEEGRWTGIVTTVCLTDATPAAFCAHCEDRSNGNIIADSILRDVRPNLLLGGDGRYLHSHKAERAGYALITDAQELSVFANKTFTRPPRIYGGFGNYPWFGWIDMEGFPTVLEDRMSGGMLYKSLRAGRGIPHLTEMTQAALNILGQSPDGFFIMIESAHIDSICHAASLFRHERFMPDPVEAVGLEVEELHRAVQAALEWAGERNDTLVLVTADHETGGLQVVQEGEQGQPSRAVFTSPHYEPGERLEVTLHHHTGIPVPIFAIGPGAEEFEGELDNTEIFKRIRKLHGRTS